MKKILDYFGLKEDQVFCSTVCGWPLKFLNGELKQWNKVDRWWEEAQNGILIRLFQDPDSIIPPKFLTYRMRRQLANMLELFGSKWLTRDHDGTVRAFPEKPVKGIGVWLMPSNTKTKGEMHTITDKSFEMVVSWDDEEPFDIAAALMAEVGRVVEHDAR